MSKKMAAVVGALGGTSIIYLINEKAPRMLGNLLDSLVYTLAEYSIKNSTKSGIFEYYMEGIKEMNEKLGKDILTSIAALVGFPLATALIFYAVDRYIEKKINKF